MVEIVKYKTIMESDKIPLLLKESTQNYECANDKFDNPEKIVRLFKEVFQIHKDTEEHLYVVAFDNAMHFIGFFEVSHGGVNCTFANPREIFMRALLCGATSIVMIHNHPSGNTIPSKDDLRTSHRIAEAGTLLGIELVDSIIIGNSYTSLQTEKLLK